MSNEPSAARVERRLATILVADVFGYSRMMGEHEERTLHNLRGHRALFDDILKTHRGRIFNTAGDAILAEFPSAVEAVRAATEIQAALRTRNEHLPEAERLWFRIGINLGDVVVQDGDLLGDGVNVAARIQTAAEPGGICISGSVYDQIQNKLTLNIATLGERSFKNIAQPVRTFAIGDGSGKAPRVVTPSSPRRWIAIGIGVALLAALGAGVYLWRDHAQREAEATIQARKATEEQQAKLAAELKAAKDALAAADAEKAKREAAEREAAKQAADLKAAKDAKDAAAKAAAAAAVAGSPKSSVAASKNVAKFDGLYQGRICKAVLRGTNAKCWNTAMTVQNGTASMSWKTTLLGKPDHAQGSVSSNGDVTLTLEAGDGGSTTGRMTGHIVDKAVTLTGTWSDGTSGNASLAWAPDRGK